MRRAAAAVAAVLVVLGLTGCDWADRQRETQDRVWRQDRAITCLESGGDWQADEQAGTESCTH